MAKCQKEEKPEDENEDNPLIDSGDESGEATPNNDNTLGLE